MRASINIDGYVFRYDIDVLDLDLGVVAGVIYLGGHEIYRSEPCSDLYPDEVEDFTIQGFAEKLAKLLQ